MYSMRPLIKLMHYRAVTQSYLIKRLLLGSTPFFCVVEKFRWRPTESLWGSFVACRELVRILRGMQGANVVNPGVLLQDRCVAYDMRRHILYCVSRHLIVRFSTEPLDPASHDLHVYKNHTFNALTPGFVHFLFTNEKTADFYSCVTLTTPMSNTLPHWIIFLRLLAVILC